MNKDDPDMYDARMQDWYTNAAVGAKVNKIWLWCFLKKSLVKLLSFLLKQISAQDIIILLDVSRSMAGGWTEKGREIIEIGKNVVLNILETLGDDDFVNVLIFSNETKPLVDCFTDSDGEPEIVQATTENIAKLMEAVNNIVFPEMEIANFTSALFSAFSLVERYRTMKVKDLSIVQQTEISLCLIHTNQPPH